MLTIQYWDRFSTNSVQDVPISDPTINVLTGELFRGGRTYTKNHGICAKPDSSGLKNGGLL